MSIKNRRTHKKARSPWMKKKTHWAVKKLKIKRKNN